MFEEVGICAVHPLFINTRLGVILYRAAWQDSKTRGVTHWGAFIEKWLWDIYQDRYHFTFDRMGNERFYMGSVNYPLVMAFEDGERNMRTHDAAMYEWFTAGLGRASGAGSANV